MDEFEHIHAADEAHLAALDAAAASFTLDDLDAPEVIEEAVIEDIEPIEIAETSELDALDAELTKSEVYEEAVADGEVDVDAEAVVEDKPRKERKPRAPKAAKAPAITRDLTALPPEAFRLLDGDAASEEIKADVLAHRPAIKKVAEKFDNVIAALHAGRLPSTYVVQAFFELDKARTLTAADLNKHFTETRGYGKGTANSQTGQIMALFPLLAIAVRDGNKLTLRDDSVLAEKLRHIIATA